MSEAFTDIPGYSGVYKVSELGNVKNVKTGRVLKKRVCKKNGYQMVALCVNGVRDMRTIHSIVAEAFISKPLRRYCVNHIDGNKLNNSLYNLEWVSYSENTKHALANNLRTPPKGEKHFFSKLTNSNVLNIRKLYKKYGSLVLSHKYNVSQETITSIVRRQTWKHI